MNQNKNLSLPSWLKPFVGFSSSEQEKVQTLQHNTRSPPSIICLRPASSLTSQFSHLTFPVIMNHSGSSMFPEISDLCISRETDFSACHSTQTPDPAQRIFSPSGTNSLALAPGSIPATSELSLLRKADHSFLCASLYPLSTWKNLFTAFITPHCTYLFPFLNLAIKPVLCIIFIVPRQSTDPGTQKRFSKNILKW